MTLSAEEASMAVRAPSWLERRARFDAAHDRIETLFEKLNEAIHSDDLDLVHEVWDQFDPALRAHMAREEAELFPGFSIVDPGNAEVLRDDHERIRSLLGELAVCIDIHAIKQRCLHELGTLLHAHGDLEHSTLYTWAAEQIPMDSKTQSHSQSVRPRVSS
jgi:hypothetical protein